MTCLEGEAERVVAETPVRELENLPCLVVVLKTKSLQLLNTVCSRNNLKDRTEEESVWTSSNESNFVGDRTVALFVST